MSLEGKSSKRKSGAAYRKEKAQIYEEQKLGSFMLNFLQTTETDTPAVLDLTRDICINPPAVALDLTSDNSLPTVSCLEPCTSVTTLPFTGTSPTPVDGNSLLQSLSHDYSDSEVAEASFLTLFSIDRNPDTFCIEKPAITPTVDACGSNSKDHSSVMYNQSEDNIS